MDKLIIDVGTRFVDAETQQLCRVVSHNPDRGDDHWYCVPITEPKILFEYAKPNGVTVTSFNGFVSKFDAHTEWIRHSLSGATTPNRVIETVISVRVKQ